MGIFSRFNDIVNSNINALLERAENPEKIIRLVIQEMEDTLVEVRTNAARTIADQKTLQRRLRRMHEELNEWEQRAELALHKNREDLARAALVEKTTLQKVINRLKQDATDIEEQRQQLSDDIARLQAKLTEAKARKKALLMREDTAKNRIKTRTTLSDKRVDEAMANFEHLERKMDTLEGRVESYDLGSERSIEDEFADLEADEGIEQELVALKKRMQETH
jgi:phage shock protein A